MDETPVIIYFQDALGQRQRADARLIDGYTWRVLAVIGGRSFSRECGSWQGVERTLLWLRRHGHEPDGRTATPLAAALAGVT